MAFYRVEGIPRDERLDELKDMPADEAVVDRRPFSPKISQSLRNARHRPDGRVV